MSMWFSAAAVVVGAATSAYSSNQASKSAMSSASKQSAEYNLSLEKQYLHSIVRNSYSTGLLNVQLGLQKKKAAQEGFDITAQAAAAKGQAQAAASASGSVGASVDAIQNDIDMKLGEAQAVNADNYEQMLDNYNSELMLNKINATSEVLSQNPSKVTYEGQSFGSAFGIALLSGAAQAMMGYAGGKMKLGLGDRPTVGSQSGVFNGLSLSRSGYGLRG